MGQSSSGSDSATCCSCQQSDRRRDSKAWYDYYDGVQYYDLLAPNGRLADDEMHVEEHMTYLDERGVLKNEVLLEWDAYKEKICERDRWSTGSATTTATTYVHDAGLQELQKTYFRSRGHSTKSTTRATLECNESESQRKKGHARFDPDDEGSGHHRMYFTNSYRVLT